ncbi:1-aminocyclopropane-1-carboxylate deaminase [Legionella antarctica]|uniref:1-aminocyclopropane-1-carboxylate deaminase n=1 Tax=Legionella antarctica TaxID=2708020 RepID=A0A6F8T4D6_9GAMM|nr:pyridoxal-phosphate dependent enzyme [Legionella antarctica]BCA95309.1 1-aminocyclopropane-1-carboxylate deaminase [Legionella antarctica]
MWNLSSRVHKLNCFPGDGVNCYVKRDDELGCGINGSKVRKYSSLTPFLIQKKIRHLIIIAGPQSNNLLAALQVARELQLQITAFLIKPKNLLIQGNFKLSLLFLNEQEIVWVNRDEWSKVESLAHDYLDALKEKGFVLNEGASVPEALVGAMSLAEDIMDNEKKMGFNFQHIFVDAGTGFSAAGLLKGLAQLNHQSIIHVLLLADDEQTFNDKLTQWIGMNPPNYQCFYPSTARSFGSINKTLKDEIKRLAREEGILADPIYSAKLFHEARRLIEIEKLKGNVLIIHSGGTLTMPSFEF